MRSCLQNGGPDPARRGAGGAEKEYDFTARIHRRKIQVLKTQWKEWKRSGKFLPFPTDPVENPVERVKNPPRG